MRTYRNTYWSNDYLMHYGILGMKWGVRRFQNKDGTRTALGKLRLQKPQKVDPFRELIKMTNEDRMVDRQYNEIVDRIRSGNNKTVAEIAVMANRPLSIENRHDGVNLKKGSKAQRIVATADDLESYDAEHAYISFTELDNMRYLAEAGHGIAKNAIKNEKGSQDGFRLTLKLTKDVVAPSYEKAMDAFVKTYGDKTPEQLVKDIYGDSAPGFTKSNGKTTVTKAAKEQYIRDAEKILSNYKTATPEECLDKVYKAYSTALVNHPEYRKEFFNTLKKAGYNAVIDENDRGAWTDAPVIVFDKKDTLKVASTQRIHRLNIEAAEEYVDKYTSGTASKQTLAELKKQAEHVYTDAEIQRIIEEVRKKNAT